MKQFLIIFAKEPAKGKVKTRLLKYLSEERCLGLYKAFLKDIIEDTKHISCSKIIAHASETRSPKYLKALAPHYKFIKQNGRDLGKRMHNAFRATIKKRPSRVVIMGTDVPNLPIRLIKSAFKKLDKSDIVLGPSIDGGYYLIGLKKPCKALFEDIEWSSKSVFRDTLNRARALDKDVAILKKWYDVDTYNSLRKLKKDLRKIKSRSKWTKSFLKI